MPDIWTGEVVGQMHNAEVTLEELAREMGITKGYMSQILNSKRRPEGIEERTRAALERVVREKYSVDARMEREVRG